MQRNSQTLARCISIAAVLIVTLACQGQTTTSPVSARLTPADFPSDTNAANLRDQIIEQKKVLEQNPDNFDTLRKLAILYVQLRSSPDASRAEQQSALQSAIDLIEPGYQKDKSNLFRACLLAQLLTLDEHTGVGASRALAILDPFAKDPDTARRYDGLMVKGDLLVGLQITPAGYQNLKAVGQVLKDSPSLEAIDAYNDAIQIEPTTSDEAGRRLADLYFDSQKMTEATTAYARLLRMNKVPANRDKILRRYTECEIRGFTPNQPDTRAKFNEAIARLDQMIAADPRDVEALKLRSSAFIVQKSLEPTVDGQRQALQSSLDFLNRALGVDPADIQALQYRGLVTVQLTDDRNDAAIADLATTLKSPASARYSYGILARLYQRNSQTEKSASVYEAMLQSTPNDFQARLEYANYLLALALQKRAQPPDSQADLAVTLRRLDPEARLQDQLSLASKLFPAQQAQWLMIYESLLALQGKDAEALSIATSLYGAMPTEIQVLDLYLQALNRARRFDETLAVSAGFPGMKAFLETHPEFIRIYFHRIQAQLALNRRDDATADLTHVLTLASNAALANNFLAVFDLCEKAPDLITREFLVQGLRGRLLAAPADTATQIVLLHQLQFMKLPDQAVRSALTQVSPARQPASKAFLLRETAAVKSKTGQFAAAEADYQAVMDINPFDTSVMDNYALLLTDHLHDAEKATRLAAQSIRILCLKNGGVEDWPFWAAAYDALGWAKLRNGDTAGAVTALRRALGFQLTPGAWFHLATALVSAGKMGDAKDACAEGIKLATIQSDPMLADLAKLQDSIRQSPGK